MLSKSSRHTQIRKARKTRSIWRATAHRNGAYHCSIKSPQLDWNTWNFIEDKSFQTWPATSAFSCLTNSGIVLTAQTHSTKHGKFRPYTENARRVAISHMFTSEFWSCQCRIIYCTVFKVVTTRLTKDLRSLPYNEQLCNLHLFTPERREWFEGVWLLLIQSTTDI